MGKRSVNYRMKRDHALATPDKIEQRFDLTKESFQRDLDDWVRDYRTKMMTKHSSAPDFEIKISTDDSFNMGDTSVLVYLECVLPSEEMTEGYVLKA